MLSNRIRSRDTHSELDPGVVYMQARAMAATRMQSIDSTCETRNANMRRRRTMRRMSCSSSSSSSSSITEQFMIMRAWKRLPNDRSTWRHIKNARMSPSVSSFIRRMRPPLACCFPESSPFSTPLPLAPPLELSVADVHTGVTLFLELEVNLIAACNTTRDALPGTCTYM